MRTACCLIFSELVLWTHPAFSSFPVGFLHTARVPVIPSFPSPAMESLHPGDRQLTASFRTLPGALVGRDPFLLRTPTRLSVSHNDTCQRRPCSVAAGVLGLEKRRGSMVTEPGCRNEGRVLPAAGSHGVQGVRGYTGVPSCVCVHTYTKAGAGGPPPPRTSFLTPQEVRLIPERKRDKRGIAGPEGSPFAFLTTYRVTFVTSLLSLLLHVITYKMSAAVIRNIVNKVRNIQAVF